ncbi:hypothetical protein CONLIGDRAFT_648152 [Coniochaeta ligniaria NRRL 30616]|uniref:Uncharacterized protein n=1 Tax=Coniochaeta ligniaria NRRL 30616 TaxID=1408157 RepID=A0A1J7JBY4_9PEZI|nr:hypothetical protein CONLIGDRAFT_648152 [Coniochaeta ligniaria NRRL 30616]
MAWRRKYQKDPAKKLKPQLGKGFWTTRGSHTYLNEFPGNKPDREASVYVLPTAAGRGRRGTTDLEARAAESDRVNRNREIRMHQQFLFLTYILMGQGYTQATIDELSQQAQREAEAFHAVDTNMPDQTGSSRSSFVTHLFFAEHIPRLPRTEHNTQPQQDEDDGAETGLGDSITICVSKLRQRQSEYGDTYRCSQETLSRASIRNGRHNDIASVAAEEHHSRGERIFRGCHSPLSLDTGDFNDENSAHVSYNFENEQGRSIIARDELPGRSTVRLESMKWLTPSKTEALSTKHSRFWYRTEFINWRTVLLELAASSLAEFGVDNLEAFMEALTTRPPSLTPNVVGSFLDLPGDEGNAPELLLLDATSRSAPAVDHPISAAVDHNSSGSIVPLEPLQIRMVTKRVTRQRTKGNAQTQATRRFRRQLNHLPSPTQAAWSFLAKIPRDESDTESL